MRLRIGRQRVDVLDAFERGWVRAVLLAHAAFELRDRLIFVLAHPSGHGGLNRLNVVDAVPEQHRAEHGYISPGHQHFQGVLTGMNSTGGSQAGL